MRSRLFLVALAGALAAVTSGAPHASTPLMPLSEIRPGMVGVGRTVFEGTRVEEFSARILGVVENVLGPRRSLIVARLEGGPLAETGVIAGMSGSPVYVDGRLIGAVAYSLGAFSREPIAGITPIEEMTDAVTFDAPRPASARANVEFPMTRDELVAAFRRALAGHRRFAESPDHVRVVGPASFAGLGPGELATTLRPIATPLVMAGFEPDVAETLSAAFGYAGFTPAGGVAGGRPGEMPFEGPLKPGDAVGVAFVTGDLMLGGTGTVTHIDGDRVYAFGHPMFNLGPTALPLTRAYVYTVLPSLFASMKLSGIGETIGTLLQDRATTIGGRLGALPRMIPITLALRSERGVNRDFAFSVPRDDLFTPLMTYSALVNTLASYERQAGSATYEVQGQAVLRDRGAVSLDDMFSGGSASIGAAAYVAAPLAALAGNVEEEVDIERIDLTIKSAEEPRTATLERVWIDDPRPRPGRTVPLKVLLRTYRGEDILRTVPIDIPAYATGPLSIVVADGARLTQAEQREARASQPARTVSQIVSMVNRARRGNTVYVRLLSASPGAVVSGELLPALPPSVLGVLEGDRNSGNVAPLRTATLGEWEIVTSHVVSGARTLAVAVSSN
jgi:hypothetical protein